MAKIQPKIDKLMHSEYAAAINAMLDEGQSPHRVYKYLRDAEFPISVQSVYKYAEIRKKELQNQVIVSDGADQERTRLLREIEALDLLIEKGYEAIKDMDAAEVSPKLLMEAIKLKNELTGGNHAFLTEYGYNSIRQLEDKRWRLVIPFMLSYIDEGRQQEVQQGVEQIEESVFSGTPWQEEYRKAREAGSR